MKRSSARMLMKGCGIVGGILFASTFAVADVYKWVDANGQVHFADAAPKHVNATTIFKAPVESETPVTTTTTATVSTHSISPQELMERQQRFTKQLQEERLKREAEAAKQKQQQEKRDQACLRAKNQLEHFESVNRFYHENSDGTVTYLSDKDGDKFRRDAQAAYHQYCG